MRGNHFIYLCLDGGQLLVVGSVGNSSGSAFLPLDMGIAVRAQRHFHHCSVQNMFGRVHGGDPRLLCPLS